MSAEQIARCAAKLGTKSARDAAEFKRLMAQSVKHRTAARECMVAAWDLYHRHFKPTHKKKGATE